MSNLALLSNESNLFDSNPNSVAFSKNSKLVEITGSSDPTNCYWSVEILVLISILVLIAKMLQLIKHLEQYCEQCPSRKQIKLLI